MTIIWDDAGDGTVYDHNGDIIGTVDLDESLTYPRDVQSTISDAIREDSDFDNTPFVSQYAFELLLRKIDMDIERTSKGVSAPS